MHTNALATVPSSELTSRLYELRRAERRLLVEFLEYLGEVDRRRLYAELGFSSLFVFLSQHLGYSSSAAYRRSTAARLIARFPVVAECLGDGRLSLTTLVELRDVLDGPGREEVLARAAGRSEDEVKRLVAALRPRPAVPDSLRRKPSRAADAPTAESAPAAAAPEARTGSASIDAPPRARIAPLSATQHLLRATVSDEFVRDLEAVRAALGHKLPGCSLEAVLHECMRVTLAACHKRRRGAGAARPAAANENRDGATVPAAKNDDLDVPASRPSRYVPAAVRDAVWRRDGGRCTFVGTGGHVCGSTFQIEVHHVQPFARGGAATVCGLALRCRSHDLHEAERDFGREHVERAIARARDQDAAAPRQARLF